jgi:hypothetical protein
MSKFEFRVGVHDRLIVVTEASSHFYAVYRKSQDQRGTLLERRRPTTDQKLVAEARRAANAKARELRLDCLICRLELQMLRSAP